MIKVTLVTLTVLVFVTWGMSANKLNHTYRFVCSDKTSSIACERDIQLIKRTLEYQAPPLSDGWSWVVVEDSEWHELRRKYDLKHDFAFTHIGLHKTFFNRLFFDKFDVQVVEWAVAHEAVHAVCDIVDENETDKIAIDVVHRGFKEPDKTCKGHRSAPRRNGMSATATTPHRLVAMPSP